MDLSMKCFAILLLASFAAAFVPSQLHSNHAINNKHSIRMSTPEEPESNPKSKPEPVESLKSDRYDVSKLTGGAGGGDDGGFNQFDPVLSATGFLSRRFGIAGGLAVFAVLAAVEGGEIIKALNLGDGGGDDPDAATITTPSGLKITQLRVGNGGTAPLPGYVIGLRATVSIGEKVIYKTEGDEKPIAFKYGQRPFQNVICEGVEEGIKGMKVGGKRILDVPSDLAPPGVELPAGVPLTYEIELTEVLSGYF